MRFLVLSTLALVFVSTVAATRRGTAWENWLDDQKEFSLELTLQNIGPSGTSPGCVIAANSKGSVDYWYSWVRDGALVIEKIIDEYRTTTEPISKKHYERVIWEYIDFTHKVQSVKTLSASKSDPMGLGEPKYHVDGTAFMDNWGRPQNDGPALRASALIRFAQDFIRDGGEIERIHQNIYAAELPVRRAAAKKDLEMVAHNIHAYSWDLWEEEKGYHFYTSMVQHRALLDGAEMATYFKDDGAAQYYRKQAAALEPLINSFWDENRGYIIASKDHQDGIDWKKSQLDVAVILGVLHARGKDGGFFAPDDDRVLATAKRIHDRHRDFFPINKKYRPDLPPAIGRYEEDRFAGDNFNGGNPWFLATLAFAEHAFRILERGVNQGYFRVTPRALGYYNTLPGVQLQPGVYKAGSSQFEAIAHGLVDFGDGFIERCKVHMGGRSDLGQGRMDEQIDRHHGVMRAATDLTWSYVAFISAHSARIDAYNVFPRAFEPFEEEVSSPSSSTSDEESTGSSKTPTGNKSVDSAEDRPLRRSKTSSDFDSESPTSQKDEVVESPEMGSIQRHADQFKNKNLPPPLFTNFPRNPPKMSKSSNSNHS